MRDAATVEPTTDTVQHKSRPKNGVLSFTRMSGSSIAALDAATWVTDFVNAAYYRRSADEREVDDLRLASCVLTTFWYRKSPGHRLRLTDVRSTSSGRTPGLVPRRSTILLYIACLASTVLPGAQNTWIWTRSSPRSIPRNGP
jgi:hypothetical protein